MTKEQQIKAAEKLLADLRARLTKEVGTDEDYDGVLVLVDLLVYLRAPVR